MGKVFLIFFTAVWLKKLPDSIAITCEIFLSNNFHICDVKMVVTEVKLPILLLSYGAFTARRSTYIPTVFLLNIMIKVLSWILHLL